MGEASRKEPLTHYGIENDDRVEFAGRYFRALPYQYGYVLTEIDGTARYEFEHWQITEHVDRRVIEIDSGYFGIDAMNARALKYVLDAPDLPKDVIYRTRMVIMFLDGERQNRWSRSESGVTAFYDAFDECENEFRKRRGGTDRNDASDKTRVGWRQFCRIVKLFELRGRTPNALVKNYNGRNLHTKNVDYERQAFVRSWAAKKATRSKTSAVSLYAEMENENNAKEVPHKLPDIRTFQRRIRALEKLRVDAGMNGKDVARNRWLISQEGMEITRPLERVEMDEKTVDLIVFLDETGIMDALHPEVQAKVRRLKRPFLSLAMDHASRSVLAMRLLPEAPKASTAISTLRMALLPKDDYARRVGASSNWPQCGTMECVATDAGAAYANDDFAACVLLLTGRHLIPPSKNPILRGTIERFFRTIDDRYMHLFSGRTFGNVLARGTYNSVANASMTFEELADALVRLIVDCYHHTPHEGLGGETPIDAWSRLTKLYPVAPPPTQKQIASVFSMTINRKIGDHGLMFLGIPYGNEALQNLRGIIGSASVQMRVNLHDLSSVRMLTQAGDGYVEIPCLRHGFEGVGVKEWITVLRTMDRQFQDRAKVYEEWVQIALADVMAVSRAAMDNASIVEHTLSQADFERLERELVRGWRVPGRLRPDYTPVRGNPRATPPITSEPDNEGAATASASERRKSALGMGDAPTAAIPGLKKTSEGRPALRASSEPKVPLPETAPSPQTAKTNDDSAKPPKPWSFEKKK